MAYDQARWPLVRDAVLAGRRVRRQNDLAWRRREGAHTVRWKRANRARVNEQRRLRYAANPERVRTQNRRWSREHRETQNANWQRYRARRVGADGNYTAQEWRRLVAIYFGRCGYCGFSGKLTADHRTPLARGGSNNIENIIPACISCNCRKQTKSETEFRAVL